MDAHTISPVCDTFYAAAQRNQDEHPHGRTEGLRRPEERYRHELMDDEERQQLRDRVLRLRRRNPSAS